MMPLRLVFSALVLVALLSVALACIPWPWRSWLFPETW
jgi:hypothetical protein